MSKVPHFLCGANPAVLARAETLYGPIGPDYRARWRRVRLASQSMAPWRGLESMRFARTARRFELRPDPVFIIGHWQAGHSLMHRMLVCDDRLARLSLLHCVLPECFRTLGKVVSRTLAHIVPKTRNVDRMPLNMAAPQGDDFIMAGLTDLSQYFGYVFPDSCEQVLRRSVLFQGVSEGQVAEWQRIYYSMWQRVAESQGKPWFVSRNASNTARIPHLLRMFPEAKFVFMSRDPVEVFVAQQARYTGLTGSWCLQEPHIDTFEETTCSFYVALMERYLRDRQLIADGHLVEVATQDLMTAPVETMERVYTDLNLGGFPAIADQIERTAASCNGQLAGSVADVDAAIVAQVDQVWGDVNRRLGISV